MVYQNGPKLLAPVPSRPLTRVVARARSVSDSKRTGSVNGSIPSQDAYRMEVNEYIPKAGSGSKNPTSKAIPCVTVRDMHTFIPDKKQRRIWIPVAVCNELTKVLKQSREEGDKGTYNVTKLPEECFQCPVTKKMVEIERVGESTRLRTYMDAPEKERYQMGDFMEVIELRNELICRLIKFLEDVATRYRRFSAQMQIPSLYSYSGERRFYYDLRETRWGLRLHISQVTDLHRNVIGIPLESVVAFRDRINQAIQFLGLENIRAEQEEANVTGKTSSSATRNNSGRRMRNKRNLKSGKRRTSKNTAEASGDKRTDQSDEGTEDKHSSNSDPTVLERSNSSDVESKKVPPVADEENAAPAVVVGH